MAYSWGWSKNKFFNCEIEYFFKTWIGKRANEDKQNRVEWERLRILGVWYLSPYSKKQITPKDILPLPWDKTQTKEEWIEKNKHLAEAWDKLSELDER